MPRPNLVAQGVWVAGHEMCEEQTLFVPSWPHPMCNRAWASDWCVTFSLKAVEFSLMPLVDTRDEVLTLLPPPPKLEDTRDVVLLLLPPLS